MNSWAMLSLAGTLINGSLGLYVYNKGPDKRINRAFLLMIIPTITWTFSEFLLRSTPDPEIATFLSKICYASVSFAPVAWINMVYTLLDYREKMYDFFLYILLILGIFFSLTILSTDLIISGAAERYWGFTGKRTRWFFIFTIFYSLFMFYALIPLIRKYINSEKYSARGIKYGFFSIGIATPVTIGTISQIILPVVNIDVFPIASVSTVFMSVFFTIGIINYNLFSIDPAEETYVNSEKKYGLIEGKVYSVKGEDPSKAYGIFIDQISHGYKGLIFSRFGPKTVRSRFGIEKSPIISNNFKQTEETIKPGNIDYMKDIMNGFIERTDDPILFLESFEQIAIVIGEKRSVEFLQTLNRLSKEHDLSILISYNEDIFDEEMSEKIEKATEEVKKD